MRRPIYYDIGCPEEDKELFTIPEPSRWLIATGFQPLDGEAADIRSIKCTPLTHLAHPTCTIPMFVYEFENVYIHV